jgi:dihydropyrimidinase
MTTLVKNGTVVTRGDRYDADIYIDKGRSPSSARAERARGHGGGRLRQARDAGRHRRAHPPRHAVRGTTSADDFESGTIAAAHGGTTTVVDFAIQNFGEGLFPAFEGWSRKAEGKAAIDYAFHMIVRELTDQVSATWTSSRSTRA